MSSEIACLPLRNMTTGPLFASPPGTLSQLQNMTIHPDGYAEARGGLEEMKPVGGTGIGFIGNGQYTAALQLSTSYGWIRTFDSSAISPNQYSVNRALSKGGYKAFPVDAVNDALYFGADDPFSRIMVSLSLAATWGATTIVYEYWNGAAWSALTTAETITWTVLLTPQFASWTLPSDWATTTIGNVSPGAGNILKYWMRIRLSVGGGATGPRVMSAQGFWSGMRELYVYTQSPLGAGNNGALSRAGQNGTAIEKIDVGSSLYSGVGSPGRLAGYRGRVVMVNGKETKVWDGESLKDLGGPAFTDTVNLFDDGSAGNLGPGTYRYYIAYGAGPCQNTAAYADRQDVQALYGPGQAIYVGEKTIIAGRRIRVEHTGVSSTTCSSVYLYRTQDLTNVVAADRANYPGLLIQSWRVKVGGTSFENDFGVAGNYYFDDSKGYVFPQQEAYNYDVSPPSRCKYVAVYQNRLFLMDDETLYWSDPFFIDRFSQKSTTAYMKFTRAQGGRNMGIVEFADQLVAFTEDQTWGVTNVDLDVPQLFPIGLGIGASAPDAIDVGEKALIWPARDGLYAWDGGRDHPKKISGSQRFTSTGTGTDFSHMSYGNVGGSMATIHHGYYDIRFAKPARASADVGNCWRFNLDSGQWSQLAFAGLSSSIAPLCSIYAPLGNNDAGTLHPLWAKMDTLTGGGGEYRLFLGELTTQDSGNNYTCSGTMYFHQPPGGTLSPSRVIAYYQSSDGWQTPSLTNVVADPLWSSPGGFNVGTPDTGTDYNVIGGTFQASIRGTADIQIKFSAQSQAGGTVRGQRLFGAVMEGEPRKVRRGGI